MSQRQIIDLSELSESDEHNSQMMNHEFSFFKLRETKITLIDKSNSDKCSICHEEFAINTIVKILPCKHFFHRDCLSEWVISNRKSKCPLCRKNIIIRDLTK